MACGARSGLKLQEINKLAMMTGGLNGLWCPFGIETLLCTLLRFIAKKAKWPVVPVRD